MYNIIKREIKSGRKTTEVAQLINIALGAGKITGDQARELDAQVMAAANHNDNRPDLYSMVIALAARVEALEKHSGTAEEPEAPDGGTYPAWKPWDGINDNYKKGAIVSHGGKLWESTFNGQNTWEPGTIGTEALWKEYTA